MRDPDHDSDSEPLPGEDEDPEPSKEGISPDINKAILKDLNRFHRKQKGTIDVWWLFDDGGRVEWSVTLELNTPL